MKLEIKDLWYDLRFAIVFPLVIMFLVIMLVIYRIKGGNFCELNEI